MKANSIRIFMLGFLVNACLWRLAVGRDADIFFPLVLSVLCLILIIVQHPKIKKGE